MKLWQKVFLCTLALVMAAIDLTAWLLIDSNHRTMLQRERDRAATEHSYLGAMLRDNLLYTRLQQNKVLLDEENVQQQVTLLLQSQKDQPGMGIALFSGKQLLAEMNMARELLYREVLQAEGTVQLIADDGDRTLLLMGGPLRLEGRPYRLLTCFDITEVFRQRQDQLGSVQTISVLCATVIAGVLLLLLVVLLHPLKRVNEGTRLIADGEYGRRIAVRGSGELRELAENMNQMADAVQHNVESLERVAEDRRIFIANLSHEMKTPLTSILGFADILRVKRRVSDEERREYAGVIVEETRRLRTLSGKLMELITVGSTQLDLERVELGDLLREAELALVPLLSQSGVELVVKAEDGLAVNIDRELFKSLIYNLVDNARKASSAGKTVELAAGRWNGRVVLLVRDHGIGIPQDQIDRVL
jgi:signal transduction histidine kinase